MNSLEPYCALSNPIHSSNFHHSNIYIHIAFFFISSISKSLKVICQKEDGRSSTSFIINNWALWHGHVVSRIKKIIMVFLKKTEWFICIYMKHAPLFFWRISWRYLLIWAIIKRSTKPSTSNFLYVYAVIALKQWGKQHHRFE